MNISTKEAEYVLAIIAEGSIRRAAEKLYIAQPSLTQAVHKMEKQWGVTLFVKDCNRMKPTYAGQRLAETCSMIVKACRDMENEFEEITQRCRGSVIIGMPFNLGSYIFPLLHAIYDKKYPDTKLVPVEGTSEELEKMLVDRLIDIAIMPLPSKNRLLEERKIFEEKMVLSIPRDYKLNECATQKDGCRHPNIDIHLADGAPFLLSPPGQKVRFAEENIFKQAKMKPRIVFVTKNIETKKRMSAAGFGLALFPEHYLEFYPVPEGAHYYYLIEKYNSTWTVGAVYMREGFISQTNAECLSVLARLFADNRPFALRTMQGISGHSAR